MKTKRNKHQGRIQANGPPDSAGRLFSGQVTCLQQFPSRQVADEVAIGRKKVVTGQVGQLAPAQIVKNPVGDFAAKLMHCKELQIDRAPAPIGMAHARDSGADLGVDAQFFVKLAGQGLLGSLPRLHFAARELPL